METSSTWELLAELLKQVIAPAAVQLGVSALGGMMGGTTPGQSPGLPGISGGTLGTPGVVNQGTASRPMSLNFQGGFTGGPPIAGVNPGESEGKSGGTGFSTLGPSRYGKPDPLRGFGSMY